MLTLPVLFDAARPAENRRRPVLCYVPLVRQATSPAVLPIPCDIAILTNEYPPHVYGGGGRPCRVPDARTGDLGRGQAPRPGPVLRRPAYQERGPRGARVSAPDGLPARDPRHAKFFATMAQNLTMSGLLDDIDVVHCHTLVHAPGRVPGQVPPAGPAGAHHALARAAPAVEGRTARHGLLRLELGRTHRLRERRRRGGRLASMQQDVESLYRVPPERIRVIHNGIDLDQYRPRPDPPSWRSTASTRTCRSCCSSGESPVRKGSSTSSMPSGISEAVFRSCSVRGPRHARDRPRDDRGGGARKRRPQTGSSGSRRCCRKPR